MNKQPILNVGIMKATHIEFILETGYRVGTNIIPQGTYTIELRKGKMILQGQSFLTISEEEIILLPVFRTNSFVLKEVTIGIDFHWEQKEDQRFTGGIRFLIEQDAIQVINTIHLEDYLKSVISSEMSANSSVELLKAHAVISRSWLIAQINKKKKIANNTSVFESLTETETEHTKWYDREDHHTFDVCADDHCQRYHGITKIISSTATNAIDDTMGEILKHNDEICDARFSKCCGGVTESFENNWEPLHKPYLVAVADKEPLGSSPKQQLTKEEIAREWILSSPKAFCNTSDIKILNQVLPSFDQKTSDFFRWTVQYTQQEIKALLTKKSGIDFGDILRLEPLERGQSGRILRLRIIGTKKTLIIGKELEIRKWLSATHLYSSAFVIDYDQIENGIPGKFIIRGAGWGHGAGLCQIGAAVMGNKGFSYDQILKHYFVGVRLEKIY
jgi:SpoIID/LytB domain protein